MKVIFLDNDGVVCLSTEWGGRKKKKLKYLKEFPGIEILPAYIKMDNFNDKAVKILNSSKKNINIDQDLKANFEILVLQLKEMKAQA